MTSPEQPDRWIAVVNLAGDDGELVEEIFENLPGGVYVKRETIQVVLETLYRLDYEISYYPEDRDGKD